MHLTPTPPAPEHGATTGSDELSFEQQARLVAGLRHWLAAQQGLGVEQIETHISWVLICGDRAYKIKKALRNTFLDQSSLALRQRACTEELRLNRRLAPDVYLAVVPVTGSADSPALGGTGTVVDVAVCMRAFAQDGLWNAMAARGALGPTQIDELVRLLSPFHAAASVAEPNGVLGSPAQVRAPLLQSLDELVLLVGTDQARAMLDRLRGWEAASFDRLRPVMALRLQQGRVRECHGDLHLGNVTQIDGRTTVFDGIEFNDDFRWIDVISDIAFMAMDLHAHGLPQQANRFVNAYLELSGDDDGVRVLDYYLVHRALVRAKVHGLRAAQCAATDVAGAAEETAALGRYLDLALRISHPAGRGAVLMFTHGFSGSGKSTLTQVLLEAAGAIRIRADVERKRLAGLQPLERSSGAQAVSLYAAGMTAATYAQLARRATPVLQSGRSVILDATFLQRKQRDGARQLADALGVPCVRLEFDADPEVLRQRLRQRVAMGADASDADEVVLSAQQRTAEPIQADEPGPVFRCRTPADSVMSGTDADGAVQADWSALLHWLKVDAAGAPAPSR